MGYLPRWCSVLECSHAATLRPRVTSVHVLMSNPGEALCCSAWSGIGTHSPFWAVNESGSYRGYICRALIVARPMRFDPKLTLQKLPHGREIPGPPC